MDSNLRYRLYRRPGLLRTRRFFCGPDLVDHLHKLFERQCRQSTNLKGAVNSGQNAPAKQVLNGVLIRHLYDCDEIILAEGGVEIDYPVAGLGEKDLGLLVDCPGLLDAHSPLAGELQQNNGARHGEPSLADCVPLTYSKGGVVVPYVDFSETMSKHFVRL